MLVNPPQHWLLKIRPRLRRIRAREMELTVGGMSLTRPSVECVRPEAPHPQLHPCAHTQECCLKALVWQKYTQLLLPLHLKPAWAFHNSGATSSHLHAGACDIRCAFTGLVRILWAVEGRSLCMTYVFTDAITVGRTVFFSCC